MNDTYSVLLCGNIVINYKTEQFRLYWMVPSHFPGLGAYPRANLRVYTIIHIFDHRLQVPTSQKDYLTSTLGNFMYQTHHRFYKRGLK